MSGSSYKRLLIYLGVPDKRIQSFLIKHSHDVEDTCLDGLMYWRRGNAVVDGKPSPVTYNMLFEAMVKADMKSASDEMRRKVIT